jgi:hypothetical protein
MLPRTVLRELTPSEAEFERRVIGLARALGWIAYHPHSARHSEAGFPDLACLRIRDGRFLLAELKVWPRLALRPAQARWHAAAARNPTLECYVWRWVFPGGVEQEIADILAADAAADALRLRQDGPQCPSPLENGFGDHPARDTPVTDVTGM